tara:strand:+ start:1506 stop:1886 length:381 start_codon:yes stop_codon:yes gene_type:complete
MKKVIKEAARLSANLWNVDVNKILDHNCRKVDTIMAKKMLIFYLYNFVELPHNQMKQYIKGVNHSTSMYHCKIFAKDIEESVLTESKFKHFIDEMRAYSLYGEEFEQKKKELELLKVELNILKHGN